MEEIKIHQFAEKLELRDYSPRSIEHYSNLLRMFFEYLEKEEGIKKLDEVERVHLNAYHAFVHYAARKEQEKKRQQKENQQQEKKKKQRKEKKHLATVTIYQRLGVVRTFFRIMHEEGLIEKDLSSMIHPPKQKQALPRNVPTVEDMKLLLESIHPVNPLLLRDRCMFELMYATGIRSAEVLSALVSDLDLAQRTLYVRGKGNKVRIVPVGSWVVRYLIEYLETARSTLLRSGETELLFVSKTGRKIDKSNLCENIARYCQSAALPRLLTPHSFRHACATHMLHNGADIRYIQELLGHSSLTSTQIYTRVDIKALKKAHQQFHPREREDGGKPNET